MKIATYRGEKIAYRTKGKGRCVVFLHGFLGSKEIWEKIAGDLSKSYRVVTIDLPGHGETPCVGYAHSMEMMAAAVKAVLDKLRISRFVLVGHSMGGYVALAYADLFPDMLRGLCLFHSTSLPDSAEKKEERLRAIELVKKNKNLYTRQVIENLFAKKNLKYLKEEISLALKIARATSPQGIVAAMHGMRDRPARDLVIGLITYPVMMVIGEHDNILSPEHLIEQSKQVKDCTLLHLEHDGHFGFLESPRRSVKELRKFLRKCFR